MTIVHFAAGGTANQATDVVRFTSDPYDLDGLQVGATSSCKITCKTDGTVVEEIDGGAENQIGTWYNNVGSASDYAVELATGTGTLSAGELSADTEYAMTENRSWWIEQVGVGVKPFTGTLQVRLSPGGSDIDTASVDMRAEHAT